MTSKFRDLYADEIECRVAQIKKDQKGARLLLYKTARTDRKLLNETVGAANWQSDYKDVGGVLFCGIGIKASAILNDPSAGSEWIWKWDAGAEPGNEKSEDSMRIKGEASDALKRAGFAWGIGEELYTSPDIWVQHDFTKPGAKYDKFIVIDITTLGGQIESVTIANKYGQVVYPASKGQQGFASSRVADTIPPDEYYPADIVPPDEYYKEQVAEAMHKATCSRCGNPCESEKVAKYSMDKYGKYLCMKCQKGGGR